MPGEFPEISREAGRKVKTFKEAHTYRCGGFCQPGKRERKQEVKSWRYTGNFLFLKMFCLFVLLNWEREKEKKKPACSTGWRNPFHISVLLFPDLLNKGNSISLPHVDACLRTARDPQKEEGKTCSRNGFSEATTHDDFCIRSLVWRLCILEP